MWSREARASLQHTLSSWYVFIVVVMRSRAILRIEANNLFKVWHQSAAFASGRCRTPVSSFCVCFRIRKSCRHAYWLCFRQQGCSSITFLCSNSPLLMRISACQLRNQWYVITFRLGQNQHICIFCFNVSKNVDMIADAEIQLD